VPTKRQVQANWRVDHFIREIVVLRDFRSGQQSLASGASFVFVALNVSVELFGFELVSVQKVHEALCYLEIVTVRFKRSELNVELE
jgi:hypothetical protein